MVGGDCKSARCVRLGLMVSLVSIRTRYRKYLQPAGFPINNGGQSAGDHEGEGARGQGGKGAC